METFQIEKYFICLNSYIFIKKLLKIFRMFNFCHWAQWQKKFLVAKFFDLGYAHCICPNMLCHASDCACASVGGTGIIHTPLVKPPDPKWVGCGFKSHLQMVSFLLLVWAAHHHPSACLPCAGPLSIRKSCAFTSHCHTGRLSSPGLQFL